MIEDVALMAEGPSGCSQWSLDTCGVTTSSESRKSGCNARMTIQTPFRALRPHGGVDHAAL